MKVAALVDDVQHFNFKIYFFNVLFLIKKRTWGYFDNLVVLFF